MAKSREEMLSALEQNIPKEEIVPAQKNEIIIGPSDTELVKDSEEDFAFARENVRKLITTSDEALAVMVNLATDSEHPRAFEVLANLIKTAADVNKQLIDLSKDRKKLLRDGNPEKKGTSIAGNVTNNAIFVGTTSDLQKKLKEKSLQTVLDVEEVV